MPDARSSVHQRLQLGGVLAAFVLLGVLAGLVVVAVTPRMLTATATSFVSTQSSDVHLLPATGFTQQATESYATVATTPLVLRSVIDALGLQETPEELAKRVSATVPQDTATIRISVTDPSAQRAARIANAVAARLGAVAESLSPQRDGGSRLGVTTIQPARTPQQPAAPDPGTALLLGALIGAASGLVVLGPALLGSRRVQ